MQWGHALIVFGRLTATQPCPSTALLRQNPQSSQSVEPPQNPERFTYSTWYGLLVPTGTPAPAVDVLQKSIASALARPDVKTRINDMGSEVVALPAAAFGERMKGELKRYEEVIRRFNIKAE
jgi:hypothetical protein